MDEGAPHTHWVDGKLLDEQPPVRQPWLRVLTVALLVWLIDGVIGRAQPPDLDARTLLERRQAEQPVSRTSLRASLEAAASAPGRPVLLVGDSVLAGDVLAPLRDDWHEQRVVDHLRRELAPSSDADFHQIALDGLLPIDALHILAELDRIDPEGRVAFVLELNWRYFSAQYREQDTCTREPICELAEGALAKPKIWWKALWGFTETARLVHDSLLAHTPVHRRRPELVRPALFEVDDLVVRRDGGELAEAKPSEALARVREHYRSSHPNRGEQARALEQLIDRLHARRRPTLLFSTPLEPEFAEAALPNNEIPRRATSLSQLIHERVGVESSITFVDLDHPLFVSAHFIDHVHMKPEGNRLLALNLLHELGLPLAERPFESEMIHDEDHDRSLVHRLDRGFADGSAWMAMFERPEGVTVSPDGSEIIIADTGNHVLRRMRGDMHFVERLAGKPTKAGLRSGPAKQAMLDHPRQPVWLDGAIYFIDGEQREHVRVLKRGYVRSVGWMGPRCSMVEQLRGISPVEGPDRLYMLCGDGRVLAVDLAPGQRITQVVLSPMPGEDLRVIEPLPDGRLLLADAKSRIWAIDPDAPEAERELVFENRAAQLLPQGLTETYPFDFDQMRFEQIVAMQWVDRYQALLVADWHSLGKPSKRLEREQTERVHLRLLDLDNREIWPWVKPIPHGDAWHMRNDVSESLSSYYHYGSFTIAQHDASLIWLERDRSRLFRIADGLLGLAKLGNVRSRWSKVSLLDPIGSQAPAQISAERRPDRYLDRRWDPLPHAGPYVLTWIGSPLAALSDRYGNYSLARRLELELQRELGYRDRLRIDLFQRTLAQPGLVRTIDTFAAQLDGEGPIPDVLLVELHNLDGRYLRTAEDASAQRIQLERLAELADRHDTLVVFVDTSSLESEAREGLRATDPALVEFAERAREHGFWVLAPSDILLAELLANSPWGNQPWGRGQRHGSPWAIDRTAEHLIGLLAPRMREFLIGRTPARVAAAAEGVRQ